MIKPNVTKRPFSLAIYSLRIKFFVLLAMVVLSDWLFFGNTVGVSFAIFFLALGVGILVANTGKLKINTVVPALAVLLLSIFPVLEELTWLSAFVCIAGLIIFTLLISQHFAEKVTTNLNYALQLTVMGVFRILLDTLLSSKVVRHLSPSSNAVSLAIWVIPVLISILFLALFAKANPIISEWLKNFVVHSGEAISGLSGKRLVFWTLIAIAVWPFLRIKLKRSTRQKKANDEFNFSFFASYENIIEQITLRSLLLFNILFAVQSALDIAYLWNGVSLPEGMTYAEYAHRGAYPLIATALLAALFVLLTLRPGSQTEQSKPIRYLVYLWILQNIFLVTSSILRLDLYVGVYQLTHLRVAAFIWMVLVALGLVYIILRILFNRSNNWLIKVNLATLALTLYVCSFINFGHIIASHNVSHSQKSNLDTRLLCNLGTEALPFIKAMITPENVDKLPALKAYELKNCDILLSSEHRRRLLDWRSWSARQHRLSLYLKGGNDGN